MAPAFTTIPDAAADEAAPLSAPTQSMLVLPST